MPFLASQLVPGLTCRQGSFFSAPHKSLGKRSGNLQVPELVTLTSFKCIMISLIADQCFACRISPFFFCFRVLDSSGLLLLGGTNNILEIFDIHVHPYLSYLDSPEPGISVYRAPLISQTSSKTHVANLLTHHIAADGR